MSAKSPWRQPGKNDWNRRVLAVGRLVTLTSMYELVGRGTKAYVNDGACYAGIADSRRLTRWPARSPERLDVGKHLHDSRVRNKLTIHDLVEKLRGP